MMNNNRIPTQRVSAIPVYDSKGNAEAFYVHPYLYNRNGDWIGWVTQQKEVYSVLGCYVGFLTNEPRILRTRVIDSPKPNKKPPSPPSRLPVPATVPLAPMMREITYSTVDVLLEEPELMHTLDSGEQREDLN